MLSVCGCVVGEHVDKQCDERPECPGEKLHRMRPGGLRNGDIMKWDKRSYARWRAIPNARPPRKKKKNQRPKTTPGKARRRTTIPRLSIARRTNKDKAKGGNARKSRKINAPTLGSNMPENRQNGQAKDILTMSLNVNGIRQKHKVTALGKYISSLVRQPDICIPV